MDKTILYTKNAAHLGDCIYSLIMFYNIKEYINSNNIYIYFYCLSENYNQTLDFNNLTNIIIAPISDIPNNVKVYDLWIGSSDYVYNWYSSIEEPITIHYDKFFCKYYTNIIQLMGIPITLSTFVYDDSDLLLRCENINKRTNNKYMNVDFLINNAAPRSGQFDYNVVEFNNFVIALSLKYNIVTTQKVLNVKCTRDDNLTAKDIAAISLNIKKFICIESGVISGLYNKYLTENVDVSVYTLSKYKYHSCSFANFNLKNKLNELYFLLDDNWYENLAPTIIHPNINSLLNTTQNILSDECIIFLINGCSGFGSQLTLLTQYSLFLKKINPRLHCLGHFSANNNSFKYHDNTCNNSFFKYFKYLKHIPLDIKIFFIQLSGVLCTDMFPFIEPQSVDGSNVNNIEINKIHSMYFKENFELKVGSDIITRINSIKSDTKTPLIGLHMRAIYQQECHSYNRILNTQQKFIQIKQLIEQKYTQYNIFIATDVETYVNDAKNIFNNSIVFYNTEVSRIASDKINNIPCDSIVNLSKFTGLKLGNDILIDCVSLICCDSYYVSVSNIAFIASYINKNESSNAIHYN